MAENTPEQIAYVLLQHIANCENKGLNGGSSYPGTASVQSAGREWILKTYAECIRTVRNGNYDPDQ